jgi:hypothetical protein
LLEVGTQHTHQLGFVFDDEQGGLHGESIPL